MRRPFMVEFTGTPEAGKTTSIANVHNGLSDLGYNVATLKESAEKLPIEIPKGTWDANLWMYYKTQDGIIQAKYFEADVVLIDSNFYGKKFLWEGTITIEQYEKFRMQFIDDLFPDYVIALTIPSDVAIKRRGGVGRLVNKEYIKKLLIIEQIYNIKERD